VTRPAQPHYSIAVLAGDGIGLEVMPPAQRVVELVAEHQGFTVAWTEYPWSCAWYHEHGAMMPADGIERLSAHDAIFLGAVGDPSLPDHVSLWGLLIPIRRAFQQYINLRPVRLLRGVRSPLAEPGEIDVTVVRENTEGEYSDVGGRIFSGTAREMAIQESIFTRHGVERVVRYGYTLARRRRQRLTGATKSNGLRVTMPFFDEIFREVGREFADVEATLMHSDALAAQLVLRPQAFDVIVGSNLLGDILSEITAAVAGSIGIAPSANLDPERRYPSLFEPIHGSAPDIAGQGIANPAGAIWAASLMLEHLGHAAAAERVLRALEATIASGVRTGDLGGTARTREMTDAVIRHLRDDA